MPKPVTVWAVRLERGGDMREAKGLLTLEEASLAFASESGGRDERVALAEIRRVRRTLGSPVLMVEHIKGGQKRSLAFYFVQPPPLRHLRPELDQPVEVERASLLGGFRSGRRRARRQNVAYLTRSHTVTVSLVKTWKAEIEEAAAQARG